MATPMTFLSSAMVACMGTVTVICSESPGILTVTATEPDDEDADSETTASNFGGIQIN